MKLTIETSPETDAALERSNQESNKGAKELPTTEEFATSLVSEILNEHVALWRQSDLGDVKEGLGKLDATDLDSVRSLIAKYGAQEKA